METINNIIGDELTEVLHEEFEELLEFGADYDEIEDLMLSYGLEMDYLEQLLF